MKKIIVLLLLTASLAEFRELSHPFQVFKVGGALDVIAHMGLTCSQTFTVGEVVTALETRYDPKGSWVDALSYYLGERDCRWPSGADYLPKL